jgi:hypothetical protein
MNMNKGRHSFKNAATSIPSDCKNYGCRIVSDEDSLYGLLGSRKALCDYCRYTAGQVCVDNALSSSVFNFLT